MPNAEGTDVYSEKPGSSLKRGEPVSSASLLSLQVSKYSKELLLNSVLIEEMFLVGCAVKSIRIENLFHSQLPCVFSVVTLEQVLKLSQPQFLHLES